MVKSLLRLLVIALVLRGLIVSAQSGMSLLGIGHSATTVATDSYLDENGSDFYLQEDGSSKYKQE